MTTSLPQVTDGEFETAVLARSRERPVLVDFWAAWCGPCRMLGPVLERVAHDYADRVAIVKLDTDANPTTAARFAIRSIPAVKLFKAGAVAAEFVGALPEGRVRAFLDEHCPSALDAAAAAARAALDAGELADAARRVEDVLAARPDHASALVVAAQLALARGAAEDALALAGRVSPHAREHDEARALAELAAVAREGGAGLDATAATAAASPGDLGARYAHAAALVVGRRWREALDELLVIVERDRRWNGEAARRAMLAIFGVLGVRSPVSDAYRKKLALLL